MQEKKFADIRYERPDYEAYAKFIEECSGEIKKAENVNALCRVLDDYWN